MQQSEVVVALVCNAAVLLLQDMPRTVLSAHIVHALCPSAPSMATPTLIVFRNSFTVCTRVSSLGLVFVGAGAFLRLWSYHTLGELFTFEVVVRPDHKLITSGPHAYVRHPSYTGVALLLLGVQLMQFGDWGYAAACHSSSPVMWVPRSW